MALGIIEGIGSLVDTLSTGNWFGDRHEELDELGAMRAMLFVLFADDNLSDEEISFLHEKKSWMPEGREKDIDELIDKTVEDLKGLDAEGRDAYAAKLAEDITDLVGVQRDALVLCCVAASVDEDGQGPQHAAFEQLAKLLRWDPARIEELARKRLSGEES